MQNELSWFAVTHTCTTCICFHFVAFFPIPEPLHFFYLGVQLQIFVEIVVFLNLFIKFFPFSEA